MNPGIRLTATHPKALLWLIRVASQRRRVADVEIKHLVSFIACDIARLSEHERDAGLGAFAALAMMEGAVGWKDLVIDESDPFVPIPPVEYWMPLKDNLRED